MNFVGLSTFFLPQFLLWRQFFWEIQYLWVRLRGVQTENWRKARGRHFALRPQINIGDGQRLQAAGSRQQAAGRVEANPGENENAKAKFA